jgi:hypothetical protein
VLVVEYDEAVAHAVHGQAGPVLGVHLLLLAEADFRRFLRVTPPVVHQMIKTLHAGGFIDRD